MPPCPRPGTGRWPARSAAAGVEAFLLRRRVLIGHQHRAAPFAAQPDALEHAQEQQHGRPDADAVVGGHQADQEGRHAHDHQRHHQHALAADAVAEVAEDQPAQRTRDEADREGGVGQHGRHQRVVRGEVQFVEHDAGDDAVQEEVVPLDGGADQRGGDDSAHRRCWPCLLSWWMAGRSAPRLAVGVLRLDWRMPHHRLPWRRPRPSACMPPARRRLASRAGTVPAI